MVSRTSLSFAIAEQLRTGSFLIAILSSIFIAPQDRSTTKAARIDELVSRYQQCGYFNGSILVGEHGKVIYEKGVGYANIQAHTPNTPQTKFGIASVSKQFTAALVLMQVAIGNLRLDATVSESALVPERHGVAHYHRATSATHFWPTSRLWRSGIRRWGGSCPARRAKSVCPKRMSAGTRVGTGYTMELQQLRLYSPGPYPRADYRKVVR